MHPTPLQRASSWKFRGGAGDAWRWRRACGCIRTDRIGAAQQLLPADGAEFYHYPRVTRLESSAVPGAASYTVELEVCQPGIEQKSVKVNCSKIRGNPPLSGIEGTSYEFLFIGCAARTLASVV
jgi:hypothetical protein